MKRHHRAVTDDDERGRRGRTSQDRRRKPEQLVTSMDGLFGKHKAARTSALLLN